MHTCSESMSSGITAPRAVLSRPARICITSCDGSAELARREERFGPKAAAPAHAKSSEPPKVPERKVAPEAEGAAKRSSHSSGSKAAASVPSSSLREGEGKPGRERKEKDREPAPGSDRESGQARERGAGTAGGKSRLSRQDLKAVMPSEKPAQTPAEGERHEADQHQDARHKDPARKARAAAPSAPSKAEAAAKPAAEHDAKKRKPGVELDDLRERALSSRRPAAKQEAPAAAAGVHIVLHMTLSELKQELVWACFITVSAGAVSMYMPDTGMSQIATVGSESPVCMQARRRHLEQQPELSAGRKVSPNRRGGLPGRARGLLRRPAQPMPLMQPRRLL